MEILNIQSFLDYYGKLRKRTLKVVQCIPAEKIEWTYMPGKFTFGDLIRHVGAIERYMYAENVQMKPNRYPGHGKELADGYEAVLEFFDRTQKESMNIFSALSDDDLHKQCITPAGAPIRIWKWLRTLAEHEIHHRGQLYIYLGVLVVQAPPLYGLTSEEVAARGRNFSASGG